MALNIKGQKAERLVSDPAAATAEGMARTIDGAAQDDLRRVLQDTSRSPNDELMFIARHCAGLPDLDHRSADEILGYDENGLSS